MEDAIRRLKTYEERIKYKKGKQVDNQEKLMFTRHKSKGKYFRGRGRGKHRFSQGKSHEKFKEEKKDGESSHRNFNKNNFKKSSYDTSKLQCYQLMEDDELRLYDMDNKIFMKVTRQRNRLYKANLRIEALDDITPYEAIKQRKPNLENLRVFSCIAYAKVSSQRLTKLDDRSSRMDWKEYMSEHINDESEWIDFKIGNLEVTNEHHNQGTQPIEEDNEFPNNDDDGYASPTTDSFSHSQTPHTPSTNDLIITGTPKKEINKFKAQMEEKFEMSDLGLLAYYLGIEVTQTSSDISIKQTAYANKILKEAGMIDCNETLIPMDPETRLTKITEGTMVNSTEYQSLIRCLRYLLHTRPDLSYSVGLLKAIRQVLRYVKGTKDYGITYKHNRGDKIHGFSDSSYGVNTQEGKETTGIIFYYATAAATQALWLKRLLSKLTHSKEENITIMVDNKSAIALMKNPVFHERISHLLENGELLGADTSSVKPKHLIDDVWDYLFLEGKEPKHSDIPLDLLKKMRKEFEYWYPLNIRVSSKDLMQNHLTFCIYNHTAIFPKKHWSRGFRCNGHLMLNSKKMSKSTGKFMTLKQAIEEFSVDATRFSLADVGDSMDDANFVVETADAAILRLTKERTWMEEVFVAESSLRVGLPSTYADRVFTNEMNFAIKMTEMNYGT
nr:leucine--tRNA ligase, cytoplasmic-like [Tanacetum cinerariifolium]